MENSGEEVVAYESRLKNFPIMMFAVVMGLSGLSLVYLKAAAWLGFPHVVANVFVGIDTLAFISISLFYIAKIFKYPKAVKGEFNHPIRVNFFAALSISLLLLAAIYSELKYLQIAKIIWYMGAIFQAFMSLYAVSYWINRNVEVKHSNPAWLIPIVGNVIVPLGGVSFVDIHVLFYFFSVGMFFWVIILAILINRIIFHHQLAQKFLPTMFILLAPPAVGMVAYIKMGNPFDMFAMGLYDIALFFSLLLLFMVKNFINIKFFISWWAFTFPVAAMSVASLIAFHKSGLLFYKIFSYLSIAVTTLVIAIVAYQTIKHMLKKEICIAE